MKHEVGVFKRLCILENKRAFIGRPLLLASVVGMEISNNEKYIESKKLKCKDMKRHIM